MITVYKLTFSLPATPKAQQPDRLSHGSGVGEEKAVTPTNEFQCKGRAGEKETNAKINNQTRPTTRRDLVTETERRERSCHANE